jgi:membrane-associated phospholipid phosphatase
MRRSSRLAVASAAAFVASAIVVWAVVQRTAFGARWDATILEGFMGLRTPAIEAFARSLVRLADPVPFAVCTAAIVAAALLRRRPRLAAMAAVVLIGANLTSQALKLLTAEPRAIEAADGPLSLELWPSGHATASMTLALCLVLVAAPRLRPLAAVLGGMCALGVVYSLLLLGWHYPSDILGGFCVAAVWASIGLAALWAAERRWPAGAARARAMTSYGALTQAAPAALAGLGVATVLALATLVRPEAALAYAEANTAFVAAATAIGSGAFAMVGALAAVLRS